MTVITRVSKGESTGNVSKNFFSVWKNCLLHDSARKRKPEENELLIEKTSMKK